MSKKEYSIPVVIFLYTRNSNFEAIIKSIKSANIAKIYLVADGPRRGEEQECREARTHIESLIDWKCDVAKIYSSTNMGLKTRFSSAITEVFQEEEMAIFIEDDCIPDPSFFEYCRALLIMYKDNHQIASISGNNFTFNKIKIQESYYFSRYPLIWGWASWRRAWEGYDPELSTWNQGGENKWLEEFLGRLTLTKYWTLIFDLVKSGRINTWDYQLTYHSFRNNYFHIIPSVNLVTNVGIDSNSTNTKIKSKTIGLAAKTMPSKLIHPHDIVRNHDADHITERNVYLTPIIITSLLGRYMLKRGMQLLSKMVGIGRKP